MFKIGKGLGKDESGIADAIKVGFKNDTLGVSAIRIAAVKPCCFYYSMGWRCEYMYAFILYIHLRTWYVWYEYHTRMWYQIHVWYMYKCHTRITHVPVWYAYDTQKCVKIYMYAGGTVYENKFLKYMYLYMTVWNT